MPLPKRLLVYSALLLIILPYFINFGLFKKFTQDEFQHCYLAWSANNFNQQIFRDLFDNHGFIHQMLNSLWLKLFNPDPGLQTLLALRVLALLYFIINCLCLFEVFYKFSRNFNYVILSPLLMSLSTIVERYAFEIRPDSLANIFQNLTLLCLISSFKRERYGYAYLSGISCVLMIFTAIKFSIFLIALILSLVSIFLFCKKNRFQIKSVMLNFFIGIISTIFLLFLYLHSTNSLENYIKYCLHFNLIAATILNSEADGSASFSKFVYFNQDIFLTLLFIVSFFFWITFEKQSVLRNLQFKLLLIICVLISLTGKFFQLWLQYDLIFVYHLCSIASWFVVLIIQNVWGYLKSIPPLILKLSSASNINFAAKFKLSDKLFPIILLFGLFNLSDININTNRAYFRQVDTLYKRISEVIKPGEKVEAFYSKCPGFGFNQHASYLIMKSSKILNTYRYLENDAIYKEGYADFLRENRVKILHGKKEILNLFEQQTRDYILKNYKLTGCYWLRVSDF